MINHLLRIAVIVFLRYSFSNAGKPAFLENVDVSSLVNHHLYSIGYPVNEDLHMKEFYEWYLSSDLYKVATNNVGNPQDGNSPFSLNTHHFENEVIDFFAPRYGFDLSESWGIITSSGTDGNNHGLYYGTKYLQSLTGQRPVVYVSEEAHYSVKKLADLQNLELKEISATASGEMIPEKFEEALDVSKPALIVLAIGTTFKGAIDNQQAIQEVLNRKTPIAIYRHLDAALFGGYLPFSSEKGQEILNRKKVDFDSISVSGHKFFGMDQIMGLFITHKDVLDKLNPIHVPYLNGHVPTITCSRSGLSALKFWWQVKSNGVEGFHQQTETMLVNTDYFKHRLEVLNYPVWVNHYSNTVFFKRPHEVLIKKYDLAKDEDVRLCGPLAHVVIMQHVTKELIDEFIEDLIQSEGLSCPPTPVEEIFEDGREDCLNSSFDSFDYSPKHEIFVNAHSLYVS
jgi:histidine decarboxylase